MISQTYKATVLSPLSYRTRPDSGAGGASVTGRFLGDIAMNYAIEYSMYGGERLWDGRTTTKPRYKEDYETFQHRCTVGIPIPESIEMMPIEFHATSFVSEGYPLLRAIKSSGSSSMKGWMQKQSISPFSQFILMVISRTNALPRRFTVRMGNGRETLVLLEENKPMQYVTLNAFTISQILGKIAPRGRSVQMENSRYILIHGISPEDASELLNW